MSQRTVLEVGCGTGAVGLVAGGLGAKRVALTDLDSLLPYVDENIQVCVFVCVNVCANVCACMCSIWHGV